MALGPTCARSPQWSTTCVTPPLRATRWRREETLAARYRKLSGQLARAWAICGGSENLAPLHPEVRFYEEVRVWMAKFDAEDRQARGEPVPEEIQRLLGQLIAEPTTSGEVLTWRSRRCASCSTRSRRRSPAATWCASGRFSERITELMNKYTNQPLTSAEVIAELIELAKEVAAEASRGARFSPPLNDDELAFYDAVAQNESAVAVQGEDISAQIARELVSVMRRDVRTDWTVRDDVRATLRSSIKRLLVKYRYPPDQQPGAIKLVLEQMESPAPRYAADRT